MISDFRKLIMAIISIAIFSLSSIAQEARWITADSPACNEPNTWIEHRKTFTIKKIGREAKAIIAADSKYWLWINGEMAVFEGSLKRGPNHTDSYYDIVDLKPFLKKGLNEIKILHCYFGKGGMSHRDSGRSGLILNAPEIGLVTDGTWESRRLSAYQISDGKEPNFWLCESNIKYDARLTDKDSWKPSVEIGAWGDAPWNGLVERPIPMWKDYGVKKLEFEKGTDGKGNIVLTARLPYNAQFTPVIELTDKGEGTLIYMETDHALLSFSTPCIHAEYVTRNGYQNYESLGWINGHKLYISYPQIRISRFTPSVSERPDMTASSRADSLPKTKCSTSTGRRP